MVGIKAITDRQGNVFFPKNEKGEVIIPAGTIVSPDWCIVLDLPDPYEAREAVSKFWKSQAPIDVAMKQMWAEFERHLEE